MDQLRDIQIRDLADFDHFHNFLGVIFHYLFFIIYITDSISHCGRVRSGQVAILFPRPVSRALLAIRHRREP